MQKNKLLIWAGEKTEGDFIKVTFILGFEGFQLRGREWEE